MDSDAFCTARVTRLERDKVVNWKREDEVGGDPRNIFQRHAAECWVFRDCTSFGGYIDGGLVEQET